MLDPNRTTLNQLLAAMLEDLLEYSGSPDDRQKTKDALRNRSWNLYGFRWNPSGTAVTFCNAEGKSLHEPFGIEDIGYDLDSLSHRAVLKAKTTRQTRDALRNRLASSTARSGDEDAGTLELARVRQRPAQQRTTVVTHQINALSTGLGQSNSNDQAVQNALRILEQLRREEEENLRIAEEADAAVRAASQKSLKLEQLLEESKDQDRAKTTRRRTKDQGFGLER